ncbi:hypothetical protein ABS768_04710 [Flavobacterium sp. ST-75]|uniref:Outer membrane protein beta-barrel domain-containing protein n=1 Tax=Flavobacterium rhizophilum TaxID=3163296 RepID=A0ABW8YAC8_9FLAO
MKTNKPNFKKQLLLLLTFLGLTFAVNAQDIRVGAHGAFPTGDASDVSSFNAGVDASVYFFDINEQVSLGVSTGYTRFFGKDETVGDIKFEYDDFTYIPITASARGLFGTKQNIFYTANLGYAVGLDDADGGFIYQANLGWTNSVIDVFAFYRGISDEITVNSFGAGVAFKVL